MIPIIIAKEPTRRFDDKGSVGSPSQPNFPTTSEKISCPHKPSAIILEIPSLGIV